MESERDCRQALLNKATGERNEIRRNYPITIRPGLHVEADKKMVNLRNEIADKNRSVKMGN